jgi:hypothetical protein
MSDVASWLRDFGREKYANTFSANEIDFRALSERSDEDLKALGLPIGPRRIVMKAVVALRGSGGRAGTAGPSVQGHAGAPAQGVNDLGVVILRDFDGHRCVDHARAYRVDLDTLGGIIEGGIR